MIAQPFAVKAEFHWKPLDGYELGTAFEGDVHIEGALPRIVVASLWLYSILAFRSSVWDTHNLVYHGMDC